jgi:threonine/homoserine/homoserine lactone efflux protein
MLNGLIGFVFVISLVIMIPGLDTANVFRSLTINGRKSAFATAAGTSIGLLVWGVAASLGISALLTASKIGFTVLRWAGGMYLLYLGIKMIKESRHITEETLATRIENRSTLWKSFTRSLIINLTNPKALVFYGAVFPQFLPKSLSTFVGGMVLTTIHCILNFLWFSFLIAGAGFAKDKLRTPKVQKIIERISGVALIGFGIRVAAEK